jgi:hypothetical protein
MRGCGFLYAQMPTDKTIAKDRHGNFGRLIDHRENEARASGSVADSPVTLAQRGAPLPTVKGSAIQDLRQQTTA